ncbi:MAG: hypothetical protein ABIS26_02420, partial [Candidatus Paceibacterota bacterium]
NRGLLPDVYKVWEQAETADENKVNHLKEIPTYRTELRKILPEQEANFVWENRNPKSVKNYNKLVARFNRELPWIKKTKNYERALEIVMDIFELRTKQNSELENEPDPEED